MKNVNIKMATILFLSTYVSFIVSDQEIKDTFADSLTKLKANSECVLKLVCVISQSSNIILKNSTFMQGIKALASYKDGPDLSSELGVAINTGLNKWDE